jgi:hypothetical protein
VDGKLKTFADRLNKAASLIKRCGKLAKEKKRRQSKEMKSIKAQRSSEGIFRKEQWRS